LSLFLLSVPTPAPRASEINPFFQVLGSKEQQAAELRKKLGITPMAQLQAKMDAFGKSETYVKAQEMYVSSFFCQIVFKN